ncbi:hypothetical protein [Actinomyces israelii]|uniref:hypothetical protein n=1 Tax=Actinomyces israelii TaxID=1659 RepID=UPI0038576BEF
MPQLAIGDEAPDFALPDPAGAEASLADLRRSRARRRRPLLPQGLRARLHQGGLRLPGLPEGAGCA